MAGETALYPRHASQNWFVALTDMTEITHRLMRNSHQSLRSFCTLLQVFYQIQMALSDRPDLTPLVGSCQFFLRLP